jgi:hypothetical protein
MASGRQDGRWSKLKCKCKFSHSAKTLAFPAPFRHIFVCAIELRLSRGCRALRALGEADLVTRTSAASGACSLMQNCALLS